MISLNITTTGSSCPKDNTKWVCDMATTSNGSQMEQSTLENTSKMIWKISGDLMMRAFPHQEKVWLPLNSPNGKVPHPISTLNSPVTLSGEVSFIFGKQKNSMTEMSLHLTIREEKRLCFGFAKVNITEQFPNGMKKAVFGKKPNTIGAFWSPLPSKTVSPSIQLR